MGKRMLSTETLIRIARAIIELTQDELDVVTIVYDNPDFDGSNNIIDCNGEWTDCIDIRFSGNSLIECLEKAVKEKKQFNEKAVGEKNV